MGAQFTDESEELDEYRFRRDNLGATPLRELAGDWAPGSRAFASAIQYVVSAKMVAANAYCSGPGARWP